MKFLCVSSFFLITMGCRSLSHLNEAKSCSLYPVFQNQIAADLSSRQKDDLCKYIQNIEHRHQIRIQYSFRDSTGLRLTQPAVAGENHILFIELDAADLRFSVKPADGPEMALHTNPAAEAIVIIPLYYRHHFKALQNSLKTADLLLKGDEEQLKDLAAFERNIGPDPDTYMRACWAVFGAVGWASFR